MLVKFCKVFSLIYFIFSSALTIWSQNLPPIQNFSPVDYKAGNQNWAISQSEEKTIYIANHSGLLEYNGAHWKLYPNPNGSIIRSVNVINDVLYTGCYMEIGFWVKDEFENLVYSSLVPKLKIPLVEDEQFWNITGFDNWIIFQSLDRIYIYNTKNEKFTIIDSKSTRAKIFVVNQEVYFQKHGDGVYKIEKGAPKKILDHPALNDTLLVGIFELNKELIFLTENGKFYRWNEVRLTDWNISAKNDLNNVNIYSSLQIKDGSILLGTISNGVIHLNEDGDIISSINMEKGLNNNTILTIFEDVEQNIWLGLDNGINVLNLNSPFRVFNDRNGKLGTVYASKIFSDNLYLGTNQGLFYKKANSEEDFTFIDQTKGQVWCLKVFGETLFCGHNDGTFVIDKNIATKVSKEEGTWDLKEVAPNSNILIQGNYSGLSVLEKSNGKWNFRNKIEGLEISCRSFEILEKTEILTNHEYQGIYRLELDPDYTKIIKLKKEAPKASESSLIRFNNEIFFTTSTGINKYDASKHLFESDSILSNIFYSEDNAILGQLVSNIKTNKLWGFTNKSIICIEPGKFDNTPHITKLPVPSFFRRTLGIVGYENINHIANKSYLIGLATGYVVLDLNKIKPKDYAVKITSVFVESSRNNTSKNQLSFEQENELKSAENNLYFTYSIPEFDKYAEAMYQYKLDGLYDDWSDWSTDTEVALKKLPYGEFTFKVRAKIGNKLSSNVDTYSFSIKRPWYLSNLLLLLYVIGAGSLFYLIHFFNKRHFKQEQRSLIKKQKQKVILTKLESEKEVMIIKNEQLKNDIANRNRELTISSMSIIKKNKILNRIKSELIEQNNFTKKDKVIQIIDENIKSNKDWEFLEEALNNADKDFFKKIKKIHPVLTPNDLRFCAYLRLNLSSKEIAPLLNISVRSVEIKRYRLRKKMELPHKGSLIDHILGI